MMRQAIVGLTGSLGALAYTRFQQPEDRGVVVLGAIVYLMLLFTLDRSGFKAVARTAWQIAIPGSLRKRARPIRFQSKD